MLFRSPVAETDLPTITVEQAKALTEMDATAAEMAQAISDLRKVISELSLSFGNESRRVDRRGARENYSPELDKT